MAAILKPFFKFARLFVLVTCGKNQSAVKIGDADPSIIALYSKTSVQYLFNKFACDTHFSDEFFYFSKFTASFSGRDMVMSMVYIITQPSSLVVPFAHLCL